MGQKDVKGDFELWISMDDLVLVDLQLFTKQLCDVKGKWIGSRPSYPNALYSALLGI